MKLFALMMLTLCVAAGFVAAGPSGAATDPRPPAVSRVDVGGGVELRVVRGGEDNDRTPVIFVPGWSTGADVWAGQMQRFGADRPVISFDPRSQGLSSQTAEGNTPEQRARDLHVLIAALGLRRPPVIVAWSQGVQDMVAYVALYGDGDLAGIVLVDAAVSTGAAAAPGPDQDEGRRRLELYAAHQRDYLQGMMGVIISKPQPDGFVDALVETGMRTPPAIGRAMLIADFGGPDRSAALKSITRPLLVIASSASPELQAQRAQAAAGKGRFEAVEDAAHAVFLDQPVRFGDLLRDFLAPLD